MMNKLFKYHLNLYSLYKVFGKNVFSAGLGMEAIEGSIYNQKNKHSPLAIQNLQKKKLIKIIYSKESKEILKDLYNFRCTYRIITDEGFRIINYINENPKLITKYLLKI